MRETLLMWAATVTDPRPVEESLDLLDLGGRAGVRMRALSGGEQRRVDLACILTGRPEVLMLDEPTTGLDPESRHRVWELIRSLREDGVAVLITTHNLEEADDLQQTLTTLLGWADQDDTRLEDLSARAASLESTFLDAAQGRGTLDPGTHRAPEVAR